MMSFSHDIGSLTTHSPYTQLSHRSFNVQQRVYALPLVQPFLPIDSLLILKDAAYIAL